MRHRWKFAIWSLLALTVYLTAESFLPASAQPTARLGVALIHGYQATGSKVMQASGVECRYEPSCSHYAEDAISYYGTVDGVLRACGRLWRCSPWGGSGYDPAVEEHSAAFVSPQQHQETAEEQRMREDAQKAAKEMGKACAAGGAGCVIIIIGGLVYLGVKIFVMIWAFKDAQARGDSNAVIWPVLIFFTSIIGLVVYLAVRPKGDFSPCPSCHKQRLSTLGKCPHCSNDSGAPAKPA